MKKTSHIGEARCNKHGTLMKIIKEDSGNYVYVEFQDVHKAVVRTAYSNFRTGSVKNPYDKTVYGIGYIGAGKYKTKINGSQTAEYIMWVSMLQRCYSESQKGRFPAYHGRCTVAEEWLNFQEFAQWYHDNYYSVPKRLHLDKDILVEGNTLYSPEKCLLVPQRINMLFGGTTKKSDYADHIEKVVNEYKGILPHAVYCAVMNRAKSLRGVH